MPIFSKSKVAIIGAGFVGSTAAYAITLRNIVSEILLIDINEEKEEGEVMDITNAMSFVDTGAVRGADFQDARDADIIIITAGKAQSQAKTESRLELMDANKRILQSIAKNVGKVKPTAIVLMVTNPVDVLTCLAHELFHLPSSQVFGTGTSLDTARLRSAVANELNVSAQDINGFVLGEHGDSEFVAWSTVSIGGRRISKCKELPKKKQRHIEKAVRQEAYKIIAKKGATFYGIGTVVADIVEAIIYNQHKILPISSRVHNWNGVSGVCLGVPAVIGRSGIEKIWPLQLTATEKRKLKKTARVLKSYIKKI